MLRLGFFFFFWITTINNVIYYFKSMSIFFICKYKITEKVQNIYIKKILQLLVLTLNINNCY